MSTNYYFKFIKKPEIKICNLPEGNLKDTLEKMMQQQIPETIHIGKRSMGWKPSFEETKYYSSVREMKEFYIENMKILTIEDEYGRSMTWTDLEVELIDWNKDNPKALSHGSELTSLTDYYYTDEDGYEFCRNEFS